MKHTFSEWMKVTRYWSFAVSAMPVLVTGAFLFSEGLFPGNAGAILNLILALAGAVILHAAGNVLSDYFDFKTGVDNEQAFAVPNLVFGKFKAEEYLKFSIILFVAGTAIGMILFIRTGLPLLIIGLAGVLLTAAYSFLKYHALGDLDIFLIFSVLIILGTTYVVCGKIVLEPLVLALPVGLITVSVLHANNTVDIESDAAAGIRTFAMSLGVNGSCRLYMAYMVIPFICIITAVIAGVLKPVTLLTLAAALPAYRNFRAAGRFRESGKEAMNGLDQASAKLQTIFSGLLTLSLLLGAAF